MRKKLRYNLNVIKSLIMNTKDFSSMIASHVSGIDAEDFGLEDASDVVLEDIQELEIKDDFEVDHAEDFDIVYGTLSLIALVKGLNEGFCVWESDIDMIFSYSLTVYEDSTELYLEWVD